MSEKSIKMVILGVVAIVAIVAVILLINGQRTGMGIYIEKGQFERGTAIRSIGSGYQTGVSDLSKGTFVTAGESQSPSAQAKRITPRIPGAYEQCMPTDESGNFMYDHRGLIQIGWEIAAYSGGVSNILECTPNYFKDIGEPLKDHVCCINKERSSLPGSTGSAYFVR